MLTQDEVKKYAHMRRLKLIDQIWKDYVQDLLLHLIYRKLPKAVFGGGTCIWKVMNGDRFSEDIDMYASSLPADMGDYLKKELGFFGISCNILKSKQTSNMLFLKMGISFPSHPREIEISLEMLSVKPLTAISTTLYSPYPDIAPINIISLSREEMLANKVSAVYGRNKPRDMHDICILLKAGTKIDTELIRKKIPKFSLPGFAKKLDEKRADWKSLEPLIITKFCSFEEEKKFIVSCFAKTPKL